MAPSVDSSVDEVIAILEQLYDGQRPFVGEFKTLPLPLTDYGQLRERLSPLRYNYDPDGEVVTFYMPGVLHEIFSGKFAGKVEKQVEELNKKLIPNLRNFNNPEDPNFIHSGACSDYLVNGETFQCDQSWKRSVAQLPAVAVEVAVSETPRHLMNKAEKLMYGAKGHISTVIGFNITQHHGNINVWRATPDGEVEHALIDVEFLHADNTQAEGELQIPASDFLQPKISGIHDASLLSQTVTVSFADLAEMLRFAQKQQTLRKMAKHEDLHAVTPGQNKPETAFSKSLTTKLPLRDTSYGPPGRSSAQLMERRELHPRASRLSHKEDDEDNPESDTEEANSGRAKAGDGGEEANSD